jgi:bifunctional DNA-binding transcriptional regulator/antitoxin component of YhaV-PrlF toxin-antitoxin module
VVAIRDGKTSTETIRQVSQLEQAMVGEHPAEEDVTYHEYVVLDSAGRLQVPREYLEQFGIGGRAELEAVDDGVLIRPVPSTEFRAGPGQGATTGAPGQPGPEAQVVPSFSDEAPPQRRGLLARLKRQKSAGG